MALCWWTTAGRSVAEYATPIWAAGAIKQLDKVQDKFLKTVLMLPFNASSDWTRGECVIPMMKHRREKTLISFWWDLMLLPGTHIMKKRYCQLLDSKKKVTWPNKIKKVFQNFANSFVR